MSLRHLTTKPYVLTKYKAPGNVDWNPSTILDYTCNNGNKVLVALTTITANIGAGAVASFRLTNLNKNAGLAGAKPIVMADNVAALGYTIAVTAKVSSNSYTVTLRNLTGVAIIPGAILQFLVFFI